MLVLILVSSPWPALTLGPYAHSLLVSFGPPNDLSMPRLFALPTLVPHSLCSFGSLLQPRQPGVV